MSTATIYVDVSRSRAQDRAAQLAQQHRRNLCAFVAGSTAPMQSWTRSTKREKVPKTPLVHHRRAAPGDRTTPPGTFPPPPPPPQENEWRLRPTSGIRAPVHSRLCPPPQKR